MYNIFIVLSLMSGEVTFVNYQSANIPFSIELLDFSAVPKEDGIELKWTTETENDNFHFEILRSKNDSPFEKVGEIDGQGTKYEPTNYEYFDLTGQGKYYYKLRDSDGEESPIVFVQNFGTFQVYPNPADSFININKEVESFEVFNNRKIKVMAGKLTQGLNISPLQSGTYYLIVNGDMKNPIEFVKK